MQDSDKNVLLDLLLAVDILIGVKADAKNPFVKSFGKSETIDEEAAHEMLLNAYADAKHLLPQAEARVDEIRKSVMEEIEAEEKAFDDSNQD